ncbi:Nramp family divalent metal transporter [Jiella mangrovi]|uniref:Divalent metal cation transporter MntH n=1 Tax=Jiella mangrovi TaxID=2821407 RepID=A0ABS4BKQ8_9HYPH|nr:Nramp family divalent metal transporter [Jiella mangrovi]MBP0617122.1 Nramp family divalent metal transporter [Jiella mangrovi]
MAAFEDRIESAPGLAANPREASLDQSYRSISVRGGSPLRRFIGFLGPGYLVAVGYMDPGNWATSIAGGSQFGYTLLAAVLLSSLMAILLQALCARFAIASGLDLAEACREYFPRWLSFPLWILAELAIVATDLAEVIGTAIALQLLFGLPLVWGVVVTALDVFLILYLQSKGFRRLEAFVASMILVIAVCFVGQLILAQPSVAAVLEGLIPSPDIVTNNQMLYLALGILGATVMPHNLYLHTGVLHTRAYELDHAGREQAIKYATIDSSAALGFAFLVNASILILAAAAFYGSGSGQVDDLTDAHALLQPLLGSSLAPILFAVALLASGLSSTVTATLAGQIVMQGFLKLRLPIVVRRLITRGIAIVPAAAVIVAYGEKGAAELLVLSQVVLSLQLPFAVIPLVMFSAQKRKMGAHMPALWLLAVTSVIAVVIVALNAKLVWDFLHGGF